MKYDSQVPTKLKKAQQWFGSIISRPIDHNSLMLPISPSGQPMEEEAQIHIAPSPTLRPAQRIQIYNQQYWWRLLNTLHESFPLVTRLYGYNDFNRVIGMPYIVKYPPNHWSLIHLGDRLPQWVEEEYHENDKQLLSDAVSIDLAYGTSFCSIQRAPLTMQALPKEGDPSSLLNQTLYLQDHVFLFDLKYDLFSFRDEFIKQTPDYWLDNDFPPLQKEIDKRFYFVLYRDRYNSIGWKEVPAAAYHLLNQFRTGTTVEQACEWLEKQDEAIFEEAMTHLHLWFQEWVLHQWFTLEKYAH